MVIKFQLLWTNLNKALQRKYLFVALLMFFGSLFETISLGAVVPVLTAAVDTEQFRSFIDTLAFSSMSDYIATKTDNELVILTCLIFIAMAVFSGIFRIFVLFSMNELTYETGVYFGYKAYGGAINRSFSEIVRTNSSELSSVLQVKVSSIINGYINSSLVLLNSLLLILVLSTGMLLVSPLLTLGMMLVLGGIYLLIGYVVKSKISENARLIAKNQTVIARIIQETSGSIRDIIISGLQDYYTRLFGEYDRNLRRRQTRNLFIASCPRYILETIGICIIALVVLVSLYLNYDLESLIPILAALALVMQRLLPALQQGYTSWTQIKTNIPALKDVISISNHANILPKENSTSSIEFNQSIELKNVCFSYIEKEQVLNGVSLRINKGEVIGIIGSSGAGKSTLVDILVGLLTPTGGEFCVDGVEVNTSDLAWTRNIAYIPQDIFLADATIRENVAFGVEPHLIDDERVIKVLKEVELYQYIHSLPENIYTVVGERGGLLSGGQIQRVGIARALYRSAKLLVVDEGTSALDDKTEKKVISNIVNYEPGLTIVMIAHRLNTLTNCDRVIKLSGGRVERVYEGSEVRKDMFEIERV